MPRSSKGPRLWKRPARRKGRKVVASAVWIIKDGGRHIATGCLAGPAEKRPPPEAEQALSTYIAQKYVVPRKERNVDVIPVADTLILYLDAELARLRGRFGIDPDDDDTIVDIRKFKKRIERLNDFFGDDMLGNLSTQRFADFVKARGSAGGARRDLEDLRAAIRHHARENLHNAVIHVTLPQKGAPRERWLSRKEAARLIWTCWRHREEQTVHRGQDKGQKILTDKRPLRHIARFVLIGLYTGTRAGAIAAASPRRGQGRSWVDLDHGIYFRLAQGAARTNKRQPPAPVPARLLAHMRRWDRLGVNEAFVEWNGKAVKSVKTGFASAITKAKLSSEAGAVTPHTLRHTAATWLMQRGVPPWQAAGFLGMSVQVLIDTYGHHHPDYMRGAADAITSKDRNSNISVVETVVDINKKRSKAT